MRNCQICLASITVLVAAALVSCGGTDVCHCTPRETVAQDFRHAEKHIPLPNTAPMEITVAQILAWSLGPNPSWNTPRSGNELILYHIANAFLQNARLISGDCDVHLEISDVPAKSAPRMIVETPVDSEYCTSRRALQDGLEKNHFRLRYVSNKQVSQSELPNPVPVSVLGLGFRDFEHNRGSTFVATPWELHPAEITVQ